LEQVITTFHLTPGFDFPLEARGFGFPLDLEYREWQERYKHSNRETERSTLLGAGRRDPECPSDDEIPYKHELHRTLK
jgi:hypothetical protein